MDRWEPTDIVGGAYSDDTKPFSAQDTVNYMVVQAERAGTRSGGILRCCPGLRELANTGSGAPIRGMRNVEGTLLVVAGQTLYRVDNRYVCHAIGTVPGTGRVRMAHNQVTNGYEVAIPNGQSGYVYKTGDGSFVQITDDAFPGAVTFDFADGYILGVDPTKRFAFTSDLLNALSYSTLDRQMAESSPDALIGQAVSHREWWLFGERTTEIWRDTGEATGTWERSSGTGLEVGAASPWAISNLDNSIFWLGSDGIVYRANGYVPQRISTYPIEQAISRCTLATAFSFVYEDRGHKVFYLTFQDGHTWGYDVATQEWHRRESYEMDRWRLNDLVKWNGMWVGGDIRNGKLYVLDWDVQAEDDQPLVRMRTTGVLSDSQNALIVNAIELVIDTGLPVSPAIPVLRLGGDLPNAFVGDTINFRYSASGGVGALTLTIVGGSLPPGLAMDSHGTITGSPTTEGTYSWVVQAKDTQGRHITLNDTTLIMQGVNPEGLFSYIIEEGGPSNTHDYSAKGFDYSGWATGKGGFGNPESASLAGHTLGTPVDGGIGRIIWLRKRVNLAGIDVRVDVFHDDGALLFWNGERIMFTDLQYYHGFAIIPAAKVTGANEIALKIIDGYDADGNRVGSANIYAALEVSGA